MYIVIGGVVLLIIIIISIYNNLVGARNQVENAFGSIDVMLKKRYDLIPNLVESVKAYMKHEKDTLTSITELRTKAVSGNLSTEERIDVENKLTGMMRNVMVAVESYPELKADSQFTMLQRSWNEAEEQISAARRAYNAAVTDYNNAIEMFPTNLAASAMGYARQPLLTAPPAEREPIAVGPLSGNR